MREDIISKLWNSGFSPLTYLIMENLDPVDLESTQAVCKKWHSIGKIPKPIEPKDDISVLLFSESFSGSLRS